MQNNLLIFGGGILQLSIILRAKKMGFHTIVIDPDPNAIAKINADLFLEVGSLDYTGTTHIASKHDVKGLVTAATDNPILMMCRIAEDLNLPFPAYTSCEKLLDKGKFKDFLIENKLPHAEGKIYDYFNKIDSTKFIYPVIVKPVKNAGSRGVLKCDQQDMLHDTIQETLVFCKNGRFIIEKYIPGDEISVEAIVLNHRVLIIQITDKIVTPPPYNVELEHIQPSKYTYLKSHIQELVQKIVDKISLNNCAIHPELKIKNDQITILEMGPRLGGDFITSHLVPLSTGINIEDAAIKIATGQPVNLSYIEKASMISYLNFPVDIEVKSSISEKEIKNNFPELVKFQMSLSPGTRIKPITNSLNRYGYFILQGSNTDYLIQKKKELELFLLGKLF